MIKSLCNVLFRSQPHRLTSQQCLRTTQLDWI